MTATAPSAEYGIHYGITGTTAIYADIDHVLLSKIVPYMAIVAGAAFVLLILAFRSILVPRMREEYVYGASSKEAMVNGYHHGARVVTAAAIIMISVFGSFLLESDPTAKSMGFALAAGVLLDAFLVRMVLIPSLLVLMGEWAWWLPKWLDKIVPDIDVEGARLHDLRARAGAARESVTVGD